MNFKDIKNKLEKRETRKKEVIEYVKKEIENGNYPSYRELLSKFNIGFWRINLKDIYPQLGVDFLDVPFKRPNGCREEMRKELINYVKIEVKNRHYPSLPYIQKKFHLIMTPYLFSSVEELYKEAGIKYKMKNSQEIKNRKAKILTSIVIQILPKLELNLIETRGTYEHGVDILAKDNEGKLVGIEIKAVNKYEILKERHFRQLARFVKSERLERIILITTTDRIKNSHVEVDNSEIINYSKLKELVNAELLNDLEYIRNQPIHIDTNEREIKKKTIIEFVQKLHKEGKKIDHIIIRKNLGLFTNTYFGSIFNLYKAANIPIPLSKLHFHKYNNTDRYLEYHINKILLYMQEEISKGNKPTGKQIQRKFRISLNRYTSMRDLYQKLGLPITYGYLKREKRFLQNF